MENNRIQFKRNNTAPSTIADGEIIVQRIQNSDSNTNNRIYIGTGNNHKFVIDSQPKTLYTTGGAAQSVIVALQAGVSGTGSLQYKKMTNGVVDSQWTTVSANVSTTADAAKKLVTSGGADYSAGGTERPVYFSGGVPTPCGFSVSPSGSAITMANGTVSKATKFDGTINTSQKCTFYQIECHNIDVSNYITANKIEASSTCTFDGECEFTAGIETTQLNITQSLITNEDTISHSIYKLDTGIYSICYRIKNIDTSTTYRTAILKWQKTNSSSVIQYSSCSVTPNSSSPVFYILQTTGEILHCYDQNKNSYPYIIINCYKIG